jgi:hypothetical protein
VDVVGSLSCEIFFFFVACFQTWSSNKIGVTREVVRGIFKFDISVRAVRNHRFASTTTSIYIRNFEMAVFKNPIGLHFPRRIDGRRSDPNFRLAPLQFYWNSVPSAKHGLRWVMSIGAITIVAIKLPFAIICPASSIDTSILRRRYITPGAPASISLYLSSWTPSSGGIFFDRSYVYFFCVRNVFYQRGRVSVL